MRELFNGILEYSIIGTQNQISSVDCNKILEEAKGDFNKSVSSAGIIFLDVNTPGMDGRDFLDEYRKLNEDQKAQIVVVIFNFFFKPY